MAATAPVDPVQARIESMALQYIQCRDWGHAWRPYSVTWQPREREYRQELQCSRCSTIRLRHLDQRGAQVDNHYDYPADYLAPKGTGRMTGADRDVLRLRSVLAVMPADTADD